MNKIEKIDIGNDFSPSPRGRYYPEDGPDSGARFREQFLRKVFDEPEKYARPVQIVLDTADGYGSSFLEEAFGGLVRGGYATAEEVKSAFVFRHDYDQEFSFYVGRIMSYIENAMPESAKRVPAAENLVVESVSQR